MLIKCPECGKQVSDKATSCPECGCPLNESKPILIKKDYKAKAKKFTIAGIIVFLLTIIVSIVNGDKMLQLKAKYVMGFGGMYPVYNFIGEMFIWIGMGLLVIGIIYWIIYFVNNNK